MVQFRCQADNIQSGSSKYIVKIVEVCILYIYVQYLLNPGLPSLSLNLINDKLSYYLLKGNFSVVMQHFDRMNHLRILHRYLL